MPAISDMVKAKGYKVPVSMVQYLEIHHFTVEDAEAAIQQFQQIGYWEAPSGSHAVTHKDGTTEVVQHQGGSAWGEKSAVPESQPSSGSPSEPSPVTPAVEVVPQ